MAKKKRTKKVAAIVHDDASRTNIPTAELQGVMSEKDKSPIQIAYERRNRDLDPQLVWRGKDEQDWSDLIVHAPPLYIQEKVHPKVLIDDLIKQSKERAEESGFETPDLFADFDGLSSEARSTEFYRHEANWTNRMILGDSLQVMSSLAEREGLRGKVQCFYIDPPYGIKFNSNFQWSTTSRSVKDGKVDHITREPEQVKAFRDTWRDGIHTYLTYLRDRLTIARDLLSDTGSVFLQIGDENVHRVRAVMDEVFGDKNMVAMITTTKTSGQSDSAMSSVADYVLWFCKDRELVKTRKLLTIKTLGGEGASKYTSAQLPDGQRLPLSKAKDERGEVIAGARPYRLGDVGSTRPAGDGDLASFNFQGRTFTPGKRTFSTNERGLNRLARADRIAASRNSISYVRFLDDFPAFPQTNVWTDIGGIQSRADPKVYVVQTGNKLIERCILMTTDPGDLVLDPTCGSGTTAMVAEQWGRRWITVDTSRVALALARTRIMGARFSYHLLADSREGQIKEAEITRSTPSNSTTHGRVRQGFVYRRVPHITLKSIANNAEIDVIWDKFQETLEPLREKLNQALGQKWEEWEIPRVANKDWSARQKGLHEDWWTQRFARQQEVDASIAAKSDFEYLYDKPYEDKSKVRVAGPFTVESLSPHRVLTVNEADELVESKQPSIGESDTDEADSFVQKILESLKVAGVQQAHKEDKIDITSLTGWPGKLLCAEGRFMEEEAEKRAGIFIGPEFGTVSRPDLVAAAREAADAGFDALIACAFNFDAHSSEFSQLGRIPVLKARMNADLHMAAELKDTDKGNLFVIFGEPDIEIQSAEDDRICVKINGVDVFHPQTGEIRSSGPEGIACWFIDTDYNEESFFVRHAYFLGANDPYRALKTTLKAEIDKEAWESLNSDTSQSFSKPSSGRIAVKVINHLGDEVMKVFSVA